ncbi:MAG: Anthranilate phosphoribosyltransferase [Opitutia bacterium UBA7350]|nr:MAG: Anthranilate phosphoribosyltransferase [Opitutae bacterium UBA7350]
MGIRFFVYSLGMATIEDLRQLISGGEDLNWEAATRAAIALADEDLANAEKAAFLIALAKKGETATEVAAFASAFRKLAVDPEVGEWASNAMDVCGTGGDGSGTFNISTTVSFIVAASGVPVFKHGNRSITSKCGSADLLEVLGFKLDAPLPVLRESLRELNFCFFFAPAFHPAFKSIMPVRKELAGQGVRTIFNLLGPLINPGQPAHQLMGVFSGQWVVPLSEALAALGLQSGLVVNGTPEVGRALDELSCAGSNAVAGLGRLSTVRGALNACDGGLMNCEFADLQGGDVADNLRLLEGLLGLANAAMVPDGLRDTVLLNAGAALWVAGRAHDLKEGVVQAKNIIESGAVGEWLERARNFYAAD